jgi:hypothetical protein
MSLERIKSEQKSLIPLANQAAFSELFPLASKKTIVTSHNIHVGTSPNRLIPVYVFYRITDLVGFGLC